MALVKALFTVVGLNTQLLGNVYLAPPQPAPRWKGVAKEAPASNSQHSPMGGGMLMYTGGGPSGGARRPAAEGEGNSGGPSGAMPGGGPGGGGSGAMPGGGPSGGGRGTAWG